MLTQRDYDIATIETETEIQELLKEWYRDYLGSRGLENGSNSGSGLGKAEGSEGNPAEIAYSAE